jgi:PAS domain S-box-containing protein
MFAQEMAMEQKSILIIEDEQIAALDLQETLRSLGYRVVGIAPTGEKAVAMADTEVPDLILMDIHLAGEMSGIEAAEKILANHSVPIIYLTAYADPGLVEQAKKTRPYGYIIKPYDERALRTEIEIALYKFGLDQNFRQENANLARWVQERTEQLAQAHEALSMSEAKFREIFNSANDAIHLHQLDGRGLPGKFIDVNEMACRMLLYKKEELLRISPLELATRYHSRPLEQIGKEILTRGSVLFETEHRRKDGGIVPVEVNFHVIVIQGEKMGLSIIRDLTRRKQDEAAFRRLSADHKAIIDHAPAMIWYKDTKNNFIRVNPAAAQAFGMPVETIEGKNASEIFPHLSDTYYRDDLAVINSGKPRLGIIEPMTTAGGEHLWVQTDKIPLRNEQGTITGILLFVVDITERRRAEEALALASRKLNLLSSITRHDILNQLTALKSYIELSKEEQDSQKLAKYISTEEKIASTLERQINFTREYQDLGVNAPAWQNVDMNIQKAVAALPMRNVTVKRDSAGLEVFADLLFEKVFYNLIDNALRYGGQAMTTIRITSEESEKGLVISVEDDGTGISKGHKKHLFERGFGHNTGLGLFLSREILSITGITITETGETGKGARFEIVVPKGGYRFTGNQ